MFSHIMVGVRDFTRAVAYDTPVLQALGVQFGYLEEDCPWAGWQSSPEHRPLFLIGRVTPTSERRACHGAGPRRHLISPTRPITTARISAIRRGTSCVWLFMGRGRRGACLDLYD
jgi:hypothetical protein